MRWGMPPAPRNVGPPVRNIRNTLSPHWRSWLKPGNRCWCRHSFAEQARAEPPAPPDDRRLSGKASVLKIMNDWPHLLATDHERGKRDRKFEAPWPRAPGVHEYHPFNRFHG